MIPNLIPPAPPGLPAETAFAAELVSAASFADWLSLLGASPREAAVAPAAANMPAPTAEELPAALVMKEAAEDSSEPTAEARLEQGQREAGEPPQAPVLATVALLVAPLDPPPPLPAPPVDPKVPAEPPRAEPAKAAPVGRNLIAPLPLPSHPQPQMPLVQAPAVSPVVAPAQVASAATVVPVPVAVQPLAERPADFAPLAGTAAWLRPVTVEAHATPFAVPTMTQLSAIAAAPIAPRTAAHPSPPPPASVPVLLPWQQPVRLTGAPAAFMPQPGLVLPQGQQPAAVPAPGPALPAVAAPGVAQSPVVAMLELQPGPPAARPPQAAEPSTEVAAAHLPRGVSPVEGPRQPVEMPARRLADEPLANHVAVQAALPSEPSASGVAPVREVAAAAAPQPEPLDPAPTRWRLQLTPPLMGEVEIEIVHEGLRVSAKAVVQQPGTVEVLREVETQVRHALERQGLQLSDFEVSCRDDGRRQGQPDNPAAQWPTPRHEPVRAHVQRMPRPQAHAVSDGLVDIYV